MFTSPVAPILLCIQSLCQAADQAMEEIADDKVLGMIAQSLTFFIISLLSIKVTTNNADRYVINIIMYIANYYMISSFMSLWREDLGYYKY